jgi:muramidase (phage lysozyme)
MDAIELAAAAADPNVKAFRWMIRKGEGTQGDEGYSVIFGGGHFVGLDGEPGTFDDFADHPRTVVTRNLGGKPLSSSAAGAYQFLERTWDGLVKQYGFRDFSPENQDLACTALIAGRHALDDVIAGRFEAAVKKCALEWASLPGSPYGQPVVTMARAKAEYEEAGGKYAPTSDDGATAQFAAPLADFSTLSQSLPDAAAQPPKEKSMLSAFISAALPSIIQSAPELMKIFGSGSAISDRNAKAAEVVAAVAKQALGAKNEQEIVDAIKADPDAAAKVRAAVQQNWLQITSLTEVGGGIAAARLVNAQQQDKPWWNNPAIFVTGVFVPLVYMVVYSVITGDFSAEVKAMVVSAIVSGLLSAMTGYWLGTSFSSAKKTDLMAGKDGA